MAPAMVGPMRRLASYASSVTATGKNMPSARNTPAPCAFHPSKPPALRNGNNSHSNTVADGTLIFAPASPSMWRSPNCVVTKAAANKAAAIRA